MILGLGLLHLETKQHHVKLPKMVSGKYLDFER